MSSIETESIPMENSSPKPDTQLMLWANWVVPAASKSKFTSNASAGTHNASVVARATRYALSSFLTKPIRIPTSAGKKIRASSDQTSRLMKHLLLA